MPHGIYLNNQNGKRVIGSDTVAPRFIRKHTRSALDIVSNYGDFIVYPITSPGKPVCFLHIPSGYAASINRIVQKTSTTYDIYVYIPNQINSGLTYSDITLYVFSDKNYATSSGYGIQVFKKDSEVAFDSGYGHARMLLFQEFSSPSGTGSYQLTGGATWAGLGISKPAFMSYQGGKGFLFYQYQRPSLFQLKFWHYYARQTIYYANDGLTWGFWLAKQIGTNTTESDARAAMIVGNYGYTTHSIFNDCVSCSYCSVTNLMNDYYGTVSWVNWASLYSTSSVFVINGSDYD